jgi:UDP-GlcNAc:undecaprenyl-phosphate GlcNAc-1-phosphate transferase
VSLAVAFAVTVLVIRALIPRAGKLGLVQHPGGHRRHAQATPLVGGLGVFVGLLAGWSVEPGVARVPALVLAGVVVVAVGTLDDRFQLPHWTRFPAHILAGWILVSLGGIALRDLGQLVTDTHAYVGAWSVPLTVFAVVGVINAMNMSDGMDGLAGSLALVASVGILSMAASGGVTADIVALSVFAASVAGFLVFNLRLGARKQARVFLGDAGSTLLGVVLAFFLIKLSQGHSAPLRPVTALWLFALPLFDAVGSMLRRLGRGRSPFVADQQHYHHYLRASGLSEHGVLAVIAAAAVVCAMVGIIGQHSGASERWMFGGFLALFSVYVVAMEFLERVFGDSRSP